LSIPLGIQSIVNFIQAGQVSTSWIVLVFIVDHKMPVLAGEILMDDQNFHRPTWVFQAL